MRAALAAEQRVDLVDDHEPGPRQRGPEAGGGEEDVQRLRRGDQDVRRPPGHRLALRRQRVAGPHGHAHLGQLEALRGGRGADAGERRAQVLLDVVVQRAQR